MFIFLKLALNSVLIRRYDLAIRRYDRRFVVMIGDSSLWLAIRCYELAARRNKQRNASFVIELVVSAPQHSVFAKVPSVYSILETDR